MGKIHGGHKLVKLGIFVFLLLSVVVIFSQSDNFLEGITGNTVLSENDSLDNVTDVLDEINISVEVIEEEIEVVNESNVSVEEIENTEEVIIGLKTPSDKKYFGFSSKSEGEIEKEVDAIRDDVVDDLSADEVVKFSSGGFAVEISEGELEDLAEDSRVAYIEPVRYFSASLLESTVIVNATETWAINVSGQNLTGVGETVCIIDTGVNYSHVDLAGRNMTSCNLDCVSNESAGCYENCSNEDFNGHGTHVAGIVAASGGVTGVASGVNYIGLKVFPGSERSGATTTGIRNAIDWCVDNSETYNVSVITMSLGTSEPLLYNSYCDSEFPSFNTSISNAYDKNISVTVSTGNDGNATHISSPACVSKAIPVADTYDANIGSVAWGAGPTCTDTTTAVDQIVCHANRNSLLRLLAPGALINSTWYDGGYDEQGGTSMATPMVAGAIAIMNQLLRLTGNNETPATIEDQLYVSGANVSSGGINYSRINLYDVIRFMEIGVVLDSPEDGNVTSVNTTFSYDMNFTCNSSSVYNLSNVTFYLWNSTGNLTYNETLNISGVDNSSVFNYTFSVNDTYVWNCLAVNNYSNSSWAKNNFSMMLNVSEEVVIEVDEEEGEEESVVTSSGSGTGVDTVAVTTNDTEVEEVEENETVNDSDVLDEEVAEYFAQDEVPKKESDFTKVLITAGSLAAVIGAIVIFVIMKNGWFRKRGTKGDTEKEEKKIKRVKDKKDNGSKKKKVEA